MSNSFESRKPRAEAKVRDLAQENERLQLALREEQARHDAKVADVKAMEKRIGELRRELDTAAALHREVKARLEGEIERLREDGLHLWIDERARLAAENTRLTSERDKAEEHRTAVALRALRAEEENTRLKGSVERFRDLWREVREHARLAKEALAIADGKAGKPLLRVAGWLGAALAHVENIETALTDYDPASDSVPFRNPDQAGAAGTKPEGLAAVQPDPEGQPSRSTSPERP